MPNLATWAQILVTLVISLLCLAVVWGKMLEKLNGFKDTLAKTAEVLAKENTELARVLDYKTRDLATALDNQKHEMAAESDRRLAALEKEVDKKADKEHTDKSFEVLRDGNIRLESKLDQVLVLLATEKKKEN